MMTIAIVAAGVIAFVVVSTMIATSNHQRSTLPASNAAQIILGDPISYPVNDSWGSVTDGFILYEVIPVTVYAPASTSMSLTVPNLPPQTWVHFGKTSVVASPAGADTTMMIMGAVAQPGNAYRLTVEASSPNLTVNSTVHIATDDSSPIVLQGNPSDELLPPSSNVQVPANTATPDAISMVYDSAANRGSPATLDANLKVLGLQVNGSTQSMPSWLSVNFSKTAFTLTQYQPIFISMRESNTLALSTTSKPVTCVVAIDETVGGVESVQHVTLTIMPPFQSAEPFP